MRGNRCRVKKVKERKTKVQKDKMQGKTGTKREIQMQEDKI